jgi:DNA-binding PadR family transcriptional regulator
MTAVFRHGGLRLYLLKLLDERPRHGYEVITLLEDRFLGLYAPSAGTVYPRLGRLEAEGLVEHELSEGRKVYRLTDAGRAELADNADALGTLEEDLTRSIAEMARDVRTQVRESVRDVRAELKQAAREVRRESRSQVRRHHDDATLAPLATELQTLTDDVLAHVRGLDATAVQAACVVVRRARQDVLAELAGAGTVP